jgi:hypothetical protein
LVETRILTVASPSYIATPLHASLIRPAVRPPRGSTV